MSDFGPHKFVETEGKRFCEHCGTDAPPQNALCQSNPREQRKMSIDDINGLRELIMNPAPIDYDQIALGIAEAQDKRSTVSYSKMSHSQFQRFSRIVAPDVSVVPAEEKAEVSPTKKLFAWNSDLREEKHAFPIAGKLDKGYMEFINETYPVPADAFSYYAISGNDALSPLQRSCLSLTGLYPELKHGGDVDVVVARKNADTDELIAESLALIELKKEFKSADRFQSYCQLLAGDILCSHTILAIITDLNTYARVSWLKGSVLYTWKTSVETAFLALRHFLVGKIPQVIEKVGIYKRYHRPELMQTDSMIDDGSVDNPVSTATTLQQVADLLPFGSQEHKDASLRVIPYLVEQMDFSRRPIPDGMYV